MNHQLSYQEDMRLMEKEDRMREPERKKQR